MKSPIEKTGVQVAQEIVNEFLYKVEKVKIIRPLEVLIIFSNKKEIRITGKFASDISKAIKREKENNETTNHNVSV
jgi:hypothetical protein